MKNRSYNYRTYNVIKGTVGVLLLIVVGILLLTGKLEFGQKIKCKNLEIINNTSIEYYGKFFLESDTSISDKLDSFLSETVLTVPKESAIQTEISISRIENVYQSEREKGSSLFLYFYDIEKPDSLVLKVLVHPDILKIRDCSVQID